MTAPPISEATDDIVPVLEPLVDSLERLANATEILAGSGLALADSPAMAELSHEAEIMGEDWDEPVHAAHSNVGILRFAATDAVRQFTRLFRSQPVPVYAHLAVARAGLESAALSYWAIERSIGSTARAQRYQAIRLRNAREMRRSPIDEFKAQGTRLNTQVRTQCTKRGWPPIANERRIEVGNQQLPGSGSLIKVLLADGHDANGLQQIGATAWWFLSGASHGVNYALIESMEAVDPEPSPTALTPNRVSIFTSSRSVSLQAVILGLGYRTLIEEHRYVFGWTSDAWTQASQTFVGQMKRLIVPGDTTFTYEVVPEAEPS